jgi:hypothetical protein
MNSKRDVIENRLKDFTDSLPLGLFKGKLGVCLYLYNKAKEETASELLNGINGHLQSMKGDISVSDGLSGVGLTVNYLVKKGYIKGNVDAVLQEIDDLIFKQLAFEKYSKSYDINQLLPILYYLSVRWELQEKNSEAEYLFKELIKKTVNDLYAHTDFQKISEPLHYSLDYVIPQLFYVMGYVASLGFYRNRIEMIMRELSPLLFSIVPRIHANRLYLLTGLDYLLKEIPMGEEGSRHRNLLLTSIDIEYLLTEEMGCKSIYVENGVASLYFLLKAVKEYAGSRINYRNKIMQIIEESPEWNILEENSAYLRSHTGLHNGACGVLWAYNIMKKDKEEEEQ